MDKMVLDGRMNLNMPNLGARQTAGKVLKALCEAIEVESAA